MKNVLRWFRRRKQKARKELRKEELVSLGYELILDHGAAIKRYYLRAPNGEMLDNLGMGWVSSAEAYSAAIKHSNGSAVKSPRLKVIESPAGEGITFDSSETESGEKIGRP
jgi:hypothetical protein